MKMLKKVSYLLIASLLFVACSSDDDGEIIVDPLGDYEFGMFVTNEGPFGTGSGTVSFISEDASTVNASIFESVNGTELGNVVQSMTFYEGFAYIIANNSNWIKVVNRYTFEEVASIETGLANPRYMVVSGTNGYVTNWGDPFVDTDDYVSVIDLASNTISENISVDFGPEKVLSARGMIYVAHQGGFGQNNQISVIDPSSNTVTSTIEVGDVPNSMVVSGTDLWVVGGGNPAFTGNETNGTLVRINTDNNSVAQVFDFETTEHPSNLSIDGSELLFALNGEVYSMSVNATSIPTTSIIQTPVYSMT